MAIRKKATKMTTAEKKRFRDVITALIADGTYGTLVSFHADMSHYMHGSMGAEGRERFLPWHRLYLLRLEQAMQSLDPLAFIPYWNWLSQRSIPSWLRTFMPRVLIPGGEQVAVSRNVGDPPPLPTSSHIADVLSENTYTEFTTALEFAHNDVHGWVGGTMGLIPTAPADPIFWLHHAQIDRLWSQWQAEAMNTGKIPNLGGSAAIIDPWSETASQIQSIANLGYSYGP